MRLGAVVRCDESRGVGRQSSDFAHWMRPSRLLLVDARKAPRTTTHHFSRWADHDNMVVSLDDIGDNEIWRRFLTGLDVCWTVETPYNPYAYDVAREVGCKFVLAPNFELFPHTRLHPEWPIPDVFAWPTIWQANVVPNSVVLPTPVDRSVFKFRLRTRVDNFVHVVGMRAMHDRNGTVVLSHALPNIRQPCTVTIHSQVPGEIGVRLRPPEHVKVRLVEEDIPDPTGLYDPYDALILPRRYGGLCLPALEAASMGLPVIMPGVVPQSQWLPPELSIVSSPATTRTMAGMIRSCTPSATSLIEIMDRLVSDPALVERMSREMDQYAESVAWHNMLPLYQDFFQRVADGENVAAGQDDPSGRRPLRRFQLRESGHAF